MDTLDLEVGQTSLLAWASKKNNKTPALGSAMYTSPFQVVASVGFELNCVSQSGCEVELTFNNLVRPSVIEITLLNRPGVWLQVNVA